MRNTLLWTAIIFLAVSGVARAEEPPKEAPPMSMEKMQKEMQKAQQQMEKQQQEDLERLKTTDPKGYQARKKGLEQQAKIALVLSAYQQGSLSAEEAERKLTPLIRQQMQEESAGLDSQIKMLEKKLASLKQAKGNPSALVKKRVDQMLGRAGPPSPDEMMF